MRITRLFTFLIGFMLAALIGANLERVSRNTAQKQKTTTPRYTRHIIGSDQHGNTLYKEYSAIPPVREMFPNWLAADSLYDRGTPEWERIALHPAMLIDEWELEQQTQRLADEP